MVIKPTVIIEKILGSSGRVFVVLTEKNKYSSISDEILNVLSTSSKVIKVICDKIDTNSWQFLSEEFHKLLLSTGNRQFSVIAFGDSTTLVKNLYLREPKLIRSLILIDSSYRPHPTGFERTIDWLESKFPIGLPLRKDTNSFNSLAYLQRIRCPVLLITSNSLSPFTKAHTIEASKRIPTCWHVSLNDLSEIPQLVLEFHDTPAKCPQKNKNFLDQSTSV
jgi:hypothetical protein